MYQIKDFDSKFVRQLFKKKAIEWILYRTSHHPKRVLIKIKKEHPHGCPKIC
jgi:hypothetical protein